jgi:hypothetical protein
MHDKWFAERCEQSAGTALDPCCYVAGEAVGKDASATEGGSA